jgi:hypothetical protein
MMERLHGVASRAIEEMLARQPNTPAKVACAFHVAAGPALGRAASARWSDDGTLVIRARDAAWLAEVRRARPIIAERLTRLLGPDVVRRLIIEGDAADSSGRRA